MVAFTSFCFANSGIRLTPVKAADIVGALLHCCRLFLLIDRFVLKICTGCNRKLSLPCVLMDQLMLKIGAVLEGRVWLERKCVMQFLPHVYSLTFSFMCWSRALFKGSETKHLKAGSLSIEMIKVSVSHVQQCGCYAFRNEEFCRQRSGRDAPYRRRPLLRSSLWHDDGWRLAPHHGARLCRWKSRGETEEVLESPSLIGPVRPLHVTNTEPLSCFVSPRSAQARRQAA